MNEKKEQEKNQVVLSAPNFHWNGPEDLALRSSVIAQQGPLGVGSHGMIVNNRDGKTYKTALINLWAWTICTQNMCKKS